MKKGLLLTALFVMGLIVMAGCSKPTPQEVAMKSAQLFKEGDYKGFVNSFSRMSNSDKSQAAGFFEEKGKALVAEKGPITQCVLAGSKIDEKAGTGTVQINLIYQKGDTIPINYEVFKEKGEWKISQLVNNE